MDGAAEEACQQFMKQLTNQMTQLEVMVGSKADLGSLVEIGERLSNRLDSLEQKISQPQGARQNIEPYVDKPQKTRDITARLDRNLPALAQSQPSSKYLPTSRSTEDDFLGPYYKRNLVFHQVPEVDDANENITETITSLIKVELALDADDVIDVKC